MEKNEVWNLPIMWMSNTSTCDVETQIVIKTTAKDWVCETTCQSCPIINQNSQEK